MKLRGHAYFVELVGRRQPPPWWLFVTLAMLVGAAAVLSERTPSGAPFWAQTK